MSVVKKQFSLTFNEKPVTLEYDEKDNLFRGKLEDSSSIKITKHFVIMEGSRKVEKDRFEFRVEHEKGDVFEFTASQRGKSFFSENEDAYKMLLKAHLRKEGDEILIQGMTGEDARRFKKYDPTLTVNSFGWLNFENARKAQELVKNESLELCRCAFTKERLEKIVLFSHELEKAAEFAKQIEKIREQAGASINNLK
jgi:hypothetical protein